ncbi:hypothetical protein N866_16445, partial [Actinotalea ferrariae CF5-4]
RRRRARAAVLLTAVTVLTGCAPAPADLGADAAGRLQEAVWAVTTAAAQGRHDAAVGALARVRDELDQAAEDGDISVQRYRAVDEALRRAEAELTAVREAAAVAAEGTPEDVPVEEETAAPAAPAPVAPVVPVEPAPHPQEPSGPDDTGQGNQGNGVGPDGNRGRGGGQGKGEGRRSSQREGGRAGR